MPFMCLVAIGVGDERVAGMNGADVLCDVGRYERGRLRRRFVGCVLIREN